MAEKLTVKQDDTLLKFLFATLNGWSKKKVKERLKSATVAVNGTVTTKHDFSLSANDIVEVGVVAKRKTSLHAISTLEILYQDSDIIAINKPHGLLSVGTTKENKQHALALLRNQLSRGKKGLQIFPVHRLDRDTSGVLLFATSKEIREKIMEKWDDAQKVYLAIVEGRPKELKGIIDQPLRLDEKEYKMHVGQHKFAKHALTYYEVKEVEPKRSLLEVRLETGRQHQIRAHLSWLGHAVVGDERYGKKGDKLGLHARYLKIYHPVKKSFLSFEVDAPSEFYGLLR
jgi:23S rRNA pseudouridine1911/1915/1917 synthase